MTDRFHERVILCKIGFRANYSTNPWEMDELYLQKIANEIKKKKKQYYMHNLSSEKYLCVSKLILRKDVYQHSCLSEGYTVANLVISNSLISNYRLSRSENLVPVLT